MAGTKEIRVKITSVKSTQKITKAMEMVAASKMRRVQERMKAARPYADKIRGVIGHLRVTNPTNHPYLVEREVKAVGIIVVSSDRGLCGSLNVNVFKNVLALVREYQAQGVEVAVEQAAEVGVEQRPGPGVVPRGQHAPYRPACGRPAIRKASFTASSALTA
jgi:F-type H+-transporting ATPase subunit gamma